MIKNLLRRNREDRVIINHERSRVVLEAIESVASQKDGGSFYDMRLEAKKKFISDNMREIIERAITVGGPKYENLLGFNIFIVEKDGNAGLYFEKK